MLRRPPRSTLPDTRFPDTTLFRSQACPSVPFTVSCPSSLPRLLGLDHLPAISGRDAEVGVHAAVALRRFLGEFHATGKQALMGGAAVVDDEYERRPGALGDDFAQGLRSHRIDRRRLRSEEAELEGRDRKSTRLNSSH